MNYENRTFAEVGRLSFAQRYAGTARDVSAARPRKAWMAKPVSLLLTLAIACAPMMVAGNDAHAETGQVSTSEQHAATVAAAEESSDDADRGNTETAALEGEAVTAAAETVEDAGAAEATAVAEDVEGSDRAAAEGDMSSETAPQPLVHTDGTPGVAIASDTEEMTAADSVTSYTVTFDSRGGSSVAPVMVPSGKIVEKPKDPVLKGHEFAGWLSKTPRGKEVYYKFHLPVTADLTLYAKWKPLKYTVTFDPNGGRGIPPAAFVEYGNQVLEPIMIPVWEGHRFTGWHTESSDGKLERYDFTDPVTDNLRLVAGWKNMTFTVTFDTVGGTPTPAAQKVVYGDPSEEPEEDPVKVGHEFTGWYQKNWHGALIPFDFFEPVYGDVTVYAGWERESYFVIFRTVNGSPVPPYDTVKYGDPTRKPDRDPEKEGYTFTGWYVEDAETGELVRYDFNAPVTEDLEIFAGWAINTFQVTFDTHGGTPIPESQTIEYENAPNRPTVDPEKYGYTFTGWTTIVNGKPVPYEFNEPTEEDITVHASWKINYYRIVFNANGGSPAPVEQSIMHGEPADQPEIEPQKPGHEFTGWYQRVDGELELYEFDVAVENDTALIAGWKVNNYYVIFDSAGGKPTPAAQKVQWDSPANQPKVQPEKPGHTFTGWYATDESGELVEFNFDTHIRSKVVLTAGWKINTFQVTFDAAGGEPTPETQQVEWGEPAEQPETDPVKQGYVFTGWYLKGAEDTRTPYDFEDAVARNLELVAGWATSRHSVVFDADGGEPEPEPQTVTNGDNVQVPLIDPQKPGSIFTGWHLRQHDGNLTPYDFAAEVHTDLTLVAGWNLETHTVTFDTQGGSPIAAITVEHGSRVTLPEQPTRVGYRFAGWQSKDAAGNLIEYSAETLVNGDLVLYAAWKPVSYLVTFDALGGELAPEPVHVHHGAVLQKPTQVPTKSGHAFTGWQLKQADGSFTEYAFDTPVHGNFTLYAGWTVAAHQVIFDSLGGSAVPNATVAHGAPVMEPAPPTKDGHVFAGWQMNGEAGEPIPYDFDQPVERDLKLVALWRVSTYTVTFDSRGGTAVPAASVEHRGKVLKPADPTLDGHVFLGWYKRTVNDKEVRYGFTASVTEDFTLYAKWKPTTYQVVFDAQGGEPAPDTQQVQHGRRVVEPETSPTKADYVFSGWQTKDTQGQLVAYDFSQPVVGALTLIAAWKLGSYQVNFDTQGGSPAFEAQVVTHGDRVAEPRIKPVKEGHRFTGWHLFDSAGNMQIYEFKEAVTENITLVAGWKAVEMIVTFDMLGGKNWKPAKISYGSSISHLSKPVKKDYIFLGWHIKNKQGKFASYDTSTPVFKNITLYAHWASAEHKINFDANGGEPIKPIIVKRGNLLHETPVPEKVGYEFISWKMQKKDGRWSNFNSKRPIKDDIDLKAYWRLLTHVIDFDTAGGDPMRSITVKDGDVLTGLNLIPKKENHDFVEWRVMNNQGELVAYDLNTQVTNKLTLFAVWKISGYQVKFETNGGTEISSITVPEGERILQPNIDPVKPGYQFTGWHIKQSNGNLIQYDFNKKAFSNISLYAEWEELNLESVYTNDLADQRSNKYVETELTSLTSLEPCENANYNESSLKQNNTLIELFIISNEDEVLDNEIGSDFVN